MSAPVYAPYVDGEGVLRLGVRPLDPAEWIEPDRHFAEQLRLKESLLATRRDDVMRALPGSEPGLAEVLDMLAEHLPARFPQLYRLDAGQRMTRADGHVLDLRDDRASPLELAGLLVQEDLCLLRDSGRGYVLAAALLCAPSHWRLADKIGRPLVAVHGPVPGYAERIGDQVDRLFSSLRVTRPVWRANWAVTNSPRLFQPSRDEPDPEASRTVTADNAGEALFVRVERQTLRRLSHSGDVLFTIRVYVDPVATVARDPARALALANAITRLSPAERDYKCLNEIREPLLTYLRSAIAGRT